VNLDKERASTAFQYQYILSQVLICVLIAFWTYLTFWWGSGVKGPTSSPVLVPNAKGGQIKAKATRSANHLWISKIVELDYWCLIKIVLLQKKLLSYGGEIRLWEKGSFWHLIKFTLEKSFDLPKQVFLI
jgi:hypothetical protein